MTRTAPQLLGVLLTVIGCGEPERVGSDDDPSGCVEGKCDGVGTTGGTETDGSTSDDDASSSGSTGDGDEVPLCEDLFEVDRDAVLDACSDRADTAFNPNRDAFRPDAMRWSCADTPNRESAFRGQEYCEYFAIVETPSGASVHGLVDGQGGQTPPGITLTAEDMQWLEADSLRPVGACVFTSWNQDVTPLLGAEDERIVAGLPLTPDTFRMKFEVNSRDAARRLVEECAVCPRLQGDPDDPSDPLHDDFSRGCFLNAELNETPDRKSDSIVCAAAGRMGECGCALDDDQDLAQQVAIADGLGFPARRLGRAGRSASPGMPIRVRRRARPQSGRL
jgi:hypothetical protein